MSTVNKSEPVHGVCGVCGSGITVDNGLIVGRDDADLLAALETIQRHEPRLTVPTRNLLRAAIAKAKGEA